MMEYRSITNVASTICACMGVTPPQQAAEPIGYVVSAVAQALGGPADRGLIFNPDALGMWMYKKYVADFAPVLREAPIEAPILTVSPSVTPVCFASMYSGATPETHGISAFAKPRLEIDTLFDAFIREGRRVAIVAEPTSSVANIFTGRKMDYYCAQEDGESAMRALKLIEQDRYDLIIVYTGVFDHVMHGSVPESPESLAAFRRHMEEFRELAEAVGRYWQGRNALLACLSDHGTHIGENGRGTHGSLLDADMQVMHFYGCKRAR